jgi:hypothetical protein
MIGVVGLEDAVVNQGMALVWISETKQRAVHDVTVERPFKKGGAGRRDDESDGSPE